MTDAISNKVLEHCKSCKRLKICCMYVLQTGNTAWVCDDCRYGKIK